MSNRRIWIFVLFLLGGAGYSWQQHRVHERLIHSGFVPEEPLQTSTTASSFEMVGYTIQPVADYKVHARVLSIETYRIGREADLSPLDFALGWGPMSDEKVFGQLHISQGNRFYYYSWKNQAPIDPAIIIHASANTHLVPANKTIERQLFKIQQGQIVTLKGQLINVQHPDGWHWNSSLTRDDTGAGACELMLVNEVDPE